MNLDNLNFGCGKKYSKEWLNIDFHSENKHVKRVNLLSGFPFHDNSFNAVYSSHVLEHFNPAQGKFLIKESMRILKKGGVLRIVVPDLEGSCREYIKILEMSDDNNDKLDKYNWIIIELLDQLVRNERSGMMGPIVDKILASDNKKLKNYIRLRTENSPYFTNNNFHHVTQKQKITFQKLYNKIIYLYIKSVSFLIPKSIRDMVFINTALGERHLWMYDEFSLKNLFSDVGFSKISRLEYNKSKIKNFNSFLLDSNSDGTPYKYNSLYIEGVK